MTIFIMIEVENLSKRFGSRLAVDDLTFTVAPGEVLGFLGPNGAGKSTTMKLITGFLRPSVGTARVNGFDIREQPLAARRELGYLPEGAPAYGEMTVAQFMAFIADIRKLKGAHRAERLESTIRDAHVQEVLDQSIETLSKGYRRRVGLAQAIMHDPEVLILDEPTDGLDPNQKQEVRDLISSMAHDKIIIISTHILEEVEAVCSRAMIIGQGRLLADATPGELMARSHYHGAVTLQLARVDGAAAAIEALPEVAGVEPGRDGTELTAIPCNGASLLPPIGRLIEQNQWQVQEIYQQQGRLDDIFRTITGANGP